MVFGYFVALPAAVHYLTNYDKAEFDIQLRAKDYYGFTTMVLLAMGVVFEMPIFILGDDPPRDPHHAPAAQEPAGRLLRGRGARRRAPGVDPFTTVIEILPLWVLYEGSIWLSVILDRRRPGRRRRRRFGLLALLWAPMARGAVKAKQAQQDQKPERGAAAAKAQPRGRKRHASGGNPNQQLFFSRMRRRAKPIYFILAVLFALTFAFLGVGSGGNSGLDQLFNGLNIFGGGGTSVSKAQKEVQKHPTDPKGFRDLATAYEAKGDTASAISALQQYMTPRSRRTPRSGASSPGCS